MFDKWRERKRDRRPVREGLNISTSCILAVHEGVSCILSLHNSFVGDESFRAARDPACLAHSLRWRRRKSRIHQRHGEGKS